ncbi:MAG: M56 family metallopeptidase [Bacteroidota bacterium]|nr:M56 family metallopeptidase [Bacteroidota bacterium]
MHAIGKTIFHSIWIGILILALLRLVLTFIPARLSGLRYSISVASLLLLFVSVLATFLILYDPVSPVRESLAVPESYRGESVIDANLIFKLFGYIYFSGVLFMLFRSLASVAYIRELRNSGEQLLPHWQLTLRQISLSLGIRRSVEFLESTRVKAPMLVGYLKPAVIVPAGMITNLPADQIETIILHELYHLKRRDFLVNIMQLFIEGLLFYHPVVWIISGFIRSEREHCCDDSVLNATGNPVNYAKALIHLAEQKYYSRLAPGAVGSTKRQFESRIKRILYHNTMKTNMREKVLSLALLAGCLIIVLTVSGFSAGPAFIRMHKVNNEQITYSADHPEFSVPDTIPELEEIEEAEWEAIKEEMEENFSDMKLDMEEIKIDIENSIKEIDWDEIRMEMELSFSDMKLDMEQIKIDIESSMNEIDWDEIREDISKDLENSKLYLDSIKSEMDL